MSFEEAKLAARKLAEDFLAAAQTNDFDGFLWEPEPDRQGEHFGKVCRYWTVAVEWKKGGVLMDGPSIIEADLLEQVAQWRP